MARRWSLQQLWIAAIVAFELVALSYFVLHAPAINDDSGVRDITVLGDAPNVRQCLPSQQRDARFVRADRCVTVRERQEALMDLVYEAKILLENLGIDYWLDSGSLLGQYRMGDVMLWDFDADMGILADGLERLRVSEVRLSSAYELNVLGSLIHESHDRDVYIPARLVEKTLGFYVDIFVFEEIDEKILGPQASACWISCAKCPSVPGRTNADGADDTSAKQFAVPSDWILPTQPCYFSTYEVRCPAQPSLYLQHLYGDDFLEPKAW